MDTSIGEKEAYAKESGMISNSPSVLKMRFMTIGKSMEALAFMRSYRNKGFIVGENVLFV